LNYELGCNPVNVCYLTGLGWKRQREIVHHYAMTDRRVLPPDGIPIGNIQAGFMWLDNYQDDLKKLSFPTDESGSNSYPLYDRWSDSFNVQTEFVVVNQARGLGTAAFLMARTPLKSQAWKPVQATITYKRAEAVDQKIVASLTVPDLPLAQATIVWEAEGQQPAFGQTYTIAPGRSTMWIEAEACWPDGRRAFAATNVTLRSN
jgi:hypothetical protein